MESANLKLSEHEVIGSNLGDPSNCFAFGIGSHASSSSSSSSSPPFSSCSTGSVGNSNNNNNNNPNASRHYKMCGDDNNIDHDHHESNNMIHNLESPWNPNNLSSSNSYHMQLAKIKDEISESFPKFTELLLNSPSSVSIDNYTHFLLKNASNNEKDSAQIDGPDFVGHFSSAGFSGTSQIYPSVNISSLNNYHQSQSFSSVMMSDQPGLSDNGSSLGAFSFNCNFGVVDDQIQRPHDRLSCDRTTNQRSSSLNSEMENLEKRSMRSNQSTAPNKKSRSESKTPSCPPFKVRKEKLGDRIAALQQLVSPFGKTDTASVLMEAIGYIKFLQNQVETLSVPYMKPSRHKSTNKTFQGLYQGLSKDDGIEEAKRDLRSRGLCLVPLSCMSYVTGDNGGGAATIWPPPNFFGM